MTNSDNMQNLFINTVDELNSISKTILNDNKTNAKLWAKIAAKDNLITHSLAHEIEILINLRNQMSHGSAGRITVSQKDIDTIKNIIVIANQTAHLFKNKKINNKEKISEMDKSYDKKQNAVRKDYSNIIFKGSDAQRTAIANSQLEISDMKKKISIARSNFDNLPDIIENDLSLEEKIELYERFCKVKNLGKSGVWDEQLGRMQFFPTVDNPKLYWKLYVIIKKISRKSSYDYSNILYKVYFDRLEAISIVLKNSDKFQMNELLVPKYSIYRISDSIHKDYRRKEKIFTDIVKAVEYLNNHTKLEFEAITPNTFETILPPNGYSITNQDMWWRAN